MSNTGLIDEVQSQGSYKRLAQILALNTRPIIVAIGSGLSLPAIKGWGELYTALRDELEQQALSNEESLERLSPYLDQLDAADGPWSRFDILRRAIPTEYRNILRGAIGVSQDARIPDVHEKIWDLPISGVISLNIDVFARRAGAKKSAGREFKTEYGMNAGRVQRILLSPHRFLYELHGKLDDESTWVFGKSQLDDLFARPGYQQLLATVFTQFTVIFVGISADDVAIGGPLRELSRKGIEGPEHFWITNRTDDEAIEWAEMVGVERITYPTDRHDLVLEIIKRLEKVRSVEVVAEPVWIDREGKDSEIPSVQELSKMPTAYIRTSLNRHAGWLLSRSKREEYDRFVRNYDELIDRAWYVPPNPDGYQLFDYKISGAPLRGAFGAVYKATSRDGKVVALKLLKREIRDNLPLLHSFRRGVQAMRILSDRDVEGMVAHLDASEIPTFVTMDWVEGPNLATAKQSQLLNSWPDILDIAMQTCRTVVAAHQLPEQVLHRDLRPANIMLRNGWERQHQSWDVVVLDFDLATYRGAATESVLAEGSAVGYLAPEQLSDQKGASSRNALVDAFGIGMTILFLAGGRDPEAYMQRSVAFDREVKTAVNQPSGHSFLATPNRVARLIKSATLDNQRERWSLPLILRELTRLLSANLGTGRALDSDLIAEEIVCNCEVLADRYQWEPDDRATYAVANGPAVSVHASASDLTVRAELQWTDTGVSNRKGLHKYLPEKLNRAVAFLTEYGWDVDKTINRSRTLNITATCPATVDSDPAMLGLGLSCAIDALTFV